MKLIRYTRSISIVGFAPRESKLVTETTGNTDRDIQSLREAADADRLTLPESPIESRWTDASFAHPGNTDYVRASTSFRILRTRNHDWNIES